jgi:hypothetical protein
MQNLKDNKLDLNCEKLINRAAKISEYKDLDELKFFIIDKFLPKPKNEIYYQISRMFKRFFFREDFIFSRAYNIEDLANKLVEENLAANLEDGLKFVPELIEFETEKYDKRDNYRYGFSIINFHGKGNFYYAFKTQIVD